MPEPPSADELTTSIAEDRARLVAGPVADRDATLHAMLQKYQARDGTHAVADAPAPPPVEYDQEGDELESITADPTIASLAPADLDARIGAIRNLLKTVNEGSEAYRTLRCDLHAAYQARWPEPKAGSDATPPVPAPAPIALAVPDSILHERGLTVDDDARAAVGALADRWFGSAAAEFRKELEGWLSGMGMEQMRTGRRWDPETVDRLVAERSSGRYTEWAAALTPLLKELPPATGRSITTLLDEMNLSDTPAFMEWANHWLARRAG